MGDYVIDVPDRGRVVARCPFVAAGIERHPDSREPLTR